MNFRSKVYVCGILLSCLCVSNSFMTNGAEQTTEIPSKPVLSSQVLSSENLLKDKRIGVLASGVDTEKRTRYVVWHVPVDSTSSYMIYRKNIIGTILEEIPVSSSDNGLIFYEEPIDKSASIDLSLGLLNDDTLITESDTTSFPALDLHSITCSASSKGFNQAVIVWSFLSDEQKLIDYKYNIYRNGKLYRSGLESNLFIDTDLTCGEKYIYSVEPYYTTKDKCEITGTMSNKVKVNIEEHQAYIKSIKSSNKDKKVKLIMKGDSEANIYRLLRSAYNPETKKYGSYKEIKRLSTTKFTDKDLKIGKYKYKVQVGYKYDTIEWGSTSKPVNITIESSIPKPIATNPDDLTPILGKNDITVEQMCAYFKKYHGVYPTCYADKGAATFKEFAQILTDLCEEYYVRNSVVFAQVMCETGTLSFKGDVSAEQCNFSGFGATGNGEPGYTFEDVEEGLTAQIQHLRLYADPDYKKPGKDPRYNARYAGKAPYLEWMSIPRNPYGVGWAMSDSYFETLIRIMNDVMSL